MDTKLELRQTAAGDFTAGRSDMSIAGLRHTFREHVFYTQGRFQKGASKNDIYMALAYTVRDQLLHRWIKTIEQLAREDVKAVAYLSAEFLLGPHLENNLINLGLYGEILKTAEKENIDMQALFDQEEEPGLGNGGL
ncbi:MAG: hypothetical protein LLF99_12775, partial [Desulfobacteraceae bacterium]|nr:hypothetical protein [Desulfobacteraceae bacterium]